MPQSKSKKISGERVPRYEFPYVRFHGRHYPLIPVSLRRGAYSVNTFALLDSGASISIFRPEIAAALRIPPKKKGNIRMGTPTGSVDIRVVRLELGIKNTQLKANVGFSTDYAASFNILGREGFFHHFSVCFNEMMKTVIMVPLRGLS